MADIKAGARIVNPLEEALESNPWVTVPLADLLADDLWSYSRLIPIAGGLWKHQLYRLRHRTRPWVATVVPDSSQVHGWRSVGYWQYKGDSEYFVIPNELAPGSLFVEALQRDRHSRRRGKWTSFAEMIEQWMVVQRFPDVLRLLRLPEIPPDPALILKKALEGVTLTLEEDARAGDIYLQASKMLVGLPPHIRRAVLERLVSG